MAVATPVLQPFYDQFELSPAYTETVQSVALQPDGKIVVSYGGPGGYGDPTGYGRLGLVGSMPMGSGHEFQYEHRTGWFSCCFGRAAS